MIPWFGAAPLKLKPMTEKSAMTSGSFIRTCLGLRAPMFARVLERRAGRRLHAAR